MDNSGSLKNKPDRREKKKRNTWSKQETRTYVGSKQLAGTSSEVKAGSSSDRTSAQEVFAACQCVASAQSETVSISPLTVEVALCLNWIDKCIVTTNFIYCYGTVRSTYKGKRLMWKLIYIQLMPAFVNAVPMQRTKQWQPLALSIPGIPVSVLKRKGKVSRCPLLSFCHMNSVFHEIGNYYLL